MKRAGRSSRAAASKFTIEAKLNQKEEWKTMKRILFNSALLVAALDAASSIVCAQALDGPQSHPQFKYST